MDKAACASHGDPDLWFPQRGGEDERQQEALRMCAACPVRAACLSYGLSMPPQSGIWAGTTEDQRVQEYRRAAAQAERAARAEGRTVLAVAEPVPFLERSDVVERDVGARLDGARAQHSAAMQAWAGLRT